MAEDDTDRCIGSCVIDRMRGANGFGSCADRQRRVRIGDSRKTRINGNNGVVKIVEHGFIDDIPDNDPHVGCVFDIEFRGYDKGDYNAVWTLFVMPPSSSEFTQLATGSVFVGEDAPHGGANDLDGVVTVNLGTLGVGSFYEHPEQGFHLKLKVESPFSLGAETKYKTFWVAGCSSCGETVH